MVEVIRRVPHRHRRKALIGSREAPMKLTLPERGFSDLGHRFPTGTGIGSPQAPTFDIQPQALSMLPGKWLCVVIILSGRKDRLPHIWVSRTIIIMSTRIRGYRYYLQQLNSRPYPSKLMDYLSALKAATYKGIFKQLFCILSQLSAISGKVQSQ
jgi:hypothetical protein